MYRVEVNYDFEPTKESFIEVSSSYCTWINWKYPVEREFKKEIFEYFQEIKSKNSSLWDGLVLMSCWHAILDNVFHATFFTCNYSTFVAWRDGIVRDNNFHRCVRNTSTIGVVHNEGHVLLGRMSKHTSTPGLVVCPGGIPDENDLTFENIVDLDRSVVRELKEEIGIDVSKYVKSNPRWVVIEDDMGKVILAKYINIKCSELRMNNEFDELYAVENVYQLAELNISDYTRSAVGYYFEGLNS